MKIKESQFKRLIFEYFKISFPNDKTDQEKDDLLIDLFKILNLKENIDHEELEEFNLASKVVLAFFQSANQGIMLAEYLPNEETSTVLLDLFHEIRNEIKKMMETDSSRFKDDLTGQLAYSNNVLTIYKEISDIAMYAGYEEWMSDPVFLNKSIQKFKEDYHNSFGAHWFDNLPAEKKQIWYDWIGGDI